MSGSKSNYIFGPLVPETRSQRRVFQENLLNAQANEKILTKFFTEKNPSLNEIPSLISTSAIPQSSEHTSSKIVSRNRSKVQNLIDNHLEKRKEKRQYYHRNCLPVEKEDIKRIVSLQHVKAEVSNVEVPESCQSGSIVESSDTLKSHDIAVPELHVEPPVEAVNQVVPEDIRELERLIQESHELLKAEGIVEVNSIFPNRPLTSDREILEELEKDLARIMHTCKLDAEEIPDSSLEQLENEINELIKG